MQVTRPPTAATGWSLEAELLLEAGAERHVVSGLPCRDELLRIRAGLKQQFGF